MTGGAHYGPRSYADPGRVFPRDRLRDPFRRLGQTLRRWLTPLIGPPAVPPTGRVLHLIGTVADDSQALTGRVATTLLIGRVTTRQALTGTTTE